MTRLRRARADVSPSAATACYALARLSLLIAYEPYVGVDLSRTFHKRKHLVEMRYKLRIVDAVASDPKLLDQERQLPLIETSITRRIKKAKTYRAGRRRCLPSGEPAEKHPRIFDFAQRLAAFVSPHNVDAHCASPARVMNAWKSAALTIAHNAAVQRPRDHVSSAARVHNEVAQMRRARDAVSRSAATACYAAGTTNGRAWRH